MPAQLKSRCLGGAFSHNRGEVLFD
jgi:hypothetical protein